MSSSLIPSRIFNMLDFDRKKSNVEVIIDYVSTEPGTVELTEKQSELLERFQKADELMRKNVHSSKEIANIMVKVFQTKEKNYSVRTAFKDMEDARYIFGSTRKTNKNYLVAAHLDEIDEAIKQMKSQGKIKELTLLFEVRTKALSQLRDDDASKRSAPAIVFNITNTQNVLNVAISEEEAEEAVREKMASKGITIDLDDEQLKIED